MNCILTPLFLLNKYAIITSDNKGGSHMSKSKKYFYLSVLLIIASFYFNAQNPILNQHFSSIVKIIFICSIINTITLIIAILFADKSIKYLPEKRSWIHRAAKALPWILFVVIVFHLISAFRTFGII